MIVKDYIIQRIGSFGVRISEADLLGFAVKLSTDSEVNAANIEEVDKLIADYIPAIIASPDVSESGMSIEIAREGLKDYYRLLCGKYGIEAQVGIEDITDNW